MYAHSVVHNVNAFKLVRGTLLWRCQSTKNTHRHYYYYTLLTANFWGYLGKKVSQCPATVDFAAARWYGIVEFNIPLDTEYVISETGGTEQ